MLETMFSRTGRISRPDYLAYQALAFAAFICAYGLILGGFCGFVLLIGPEALGATPIGIAIAGTTIALIVAVIAVWVYVGFNLVNRRIRDIGLPNWYYWLGVTVAVIAQLKHLSDPMASAIGQMALVIEIGLALIVAFAPANAIRHDEPMPI